MADEPTAPAGAGADKPAAAATAAPAKAKPPLKKKQSLPGAGDANIWRFSRRDFFSVAGWGSFFVFAAVMLGGSLRFMFPRVLFEPSTKFKAGLPGEYPPGSVSEKYKKSNGVWICRQDDGGFYALISVCTHLGCTPRWLDIDRKFKCPCHGSGFRMSGVHFEGPAPRPLERARILLGEDGQLIVDKAIIYRYEMGQWGEPGSILYV
jgi:cytochrome b6-f complex iron-sulfur subunit